MARNLFHLMAYKDEYEVARLHRQAAFHDQVADEFGPHADVTFHLQPPVASKLGPAAEDPAASRTAGAAFWGLTKMMKLRGTKLDPFGRSAERRDERRLIDEYVALVDDLAAPPRHAHRGRRGPRRRPRRHGARLRRGEATQPRALPGASCRSRSADLTRSEP